MALYFLDEFGPKDFRALGLSSCIGDGKENESQTLDEKFKTLELHFQMKLPASITPFLRPRESLLYGIRWPSSALNEDPSTRWGTEEVFWVVIVPKRRVTNSQDEQLVVPFAQNIWLDYSLNIGRICRSSNGQRCLQQTRRGCC